MTSSQRREFIGNARSLVVQATVRLDTARSDVDAAIGDGHDVLKFIDDALMNARRAIAKLDIVIKRIPTDG